jgi:hypothetical protein
MMESNQIRTERRKTMMMTLIMTDGREGNIITARGSGEVEESVTTIKIDTIIIRNAVDDKERDRTILPLPAAAKVVMLSVAAAIILPPIITETRRR